jgi:hypothetical protein
MQKVKVPKALLLRRFMQYSSAWSCETAPARVRLSKTEKEKRKQQPIDAKFERKNHGCEP